MNFYVCVTAFLAANSFYCEGSLLPGFNYTCDVGTPSKSVCGTIFGLTCPTGYSCKTNPMIADDQGVCCQKRDDVDYMEITLSVYSGRQDPVFGILESNPNFTSILTIAKTHTSSNLKSILGYRGFQITLYTGVNHSVPFYLPYRRNVTIGKCHDPDFEEMLLYTVAKLQDKQGGKLLPSMVQRVDSDIKSCTVHIDYMKIIISMYSGKQDLEFNLYKGNPNFTSIATVISSRTSTPLSGILGYRGFEVKLHIHGATGFKTITVGKCSYPGLENKLLQTLATIQDTHGHRMSSVTVQYIANEIHGCIN